MTFLFSIQFIGMLLLILGLLLPPEKVVQKAISDAKKGKDISLYSAYSKGMQFLSSILPDSRLMKARLKMQKLD